MQEESQDRKFPINLKPFINTTHSNNGRETVQAIGEEEGDLSSTETEQEGRKVWIYGESLNNKAGTSRYTPNHTYHILCFRTY